MAKKKTENIKAAPVLRAQSGGEQPTPTPEQTGTRTYQIMDPWTDRDVVNLVDVKSVDGEITEVKVNGQPAGGGGGVQTAQVLVTNNTNNTVTMTFSRIQPSGDNQYSYAEVINVASGRTNVVENIILLSNGGAYTFVDGSYNSLSFTGDITEDDGDIHITGDGTITIS